MEVVEDKVRAFLSVGYGSGYGDGYGDGDGSGDGYGSGYGDGSGDGYGDGYGYGYGDGSGDGSGYGYGKDIKTFNSQRVWQIDDVPTIAETMRGNIISGYILQSDLTLKPCYVAKVEDSFAHGATIREAVEDATKKALQDKPVKERIKEFNKQFPSNTNKYDGKDFFDWHNVLTGSCKMGRESFCHDKGLGLDKGYTVAKFIDICKDAYGGEVIRQLAESRNIKI